VTPPFNRLAREKQEPRILFRIASLALIAAVVLTTGTVLAQDASDSITSEVRVTEANERILIEEVWADAPVTDVWNAYTTDEGWMVWAAPQAQVDLRVGGTILTAYSGDIGGPTTNTLHIINYVPYELLTLNADVSHNWSEVMQQDADNLYNVILFQEIELRRTLIRSYGLGYGDSPEYQGLMQFFIEANEGLYLRLKRFLEDDEPADWSK